MKETVAKHLGKEDFHAVFGKGFQIDIGGAQPIDLADGNTMYAFLTITSRRVYSQ